MKIKKFKMQSEKDFIFRLRVKELGYHIDGLKIGCIYKIGWFGQKYAADFHMSDGEYIICIRDTSKNMFKVIQLLEEEFGEIIVDISENRIDDYMWSKM